MFRFAPLSLAVLCMALASCVTINVYFPAAAAEKAADKIIEDVWGGEGENGSQKREDKRGDVDAAPGDSAAGPMLLAAAAVLELLAPPAHAQADLNISTPAVRQLTQAMEARHGQLKKYYDSGAVGLTLDDDRRS